MNEISKATRLDFSVTSSCCSTSCSLIPFSSAAFLTGVIDNVVPSGNDSTGAETLTVTPL